MPGIGKYKKKAKGKRGFKMTSPLLKNQKDYKALYIQAKEEGASEKALAGLLSKARVQASAKSYTKKNPDAKNVKPYATGEQTT